MSAVIARRYIHQTTATLLYEYRLTAISVFVYCHAQQHPCITMHNNSRTYQPVMTANEND